MGLEQATSKTGSTRTSAVLWSSWSRSWIIAAPKGASQPRTVVSHFFQPAENLSHVSRC